MSEWKSKEGGAPDTKHKKTSVVLKELLQEVNTKQVMTGVDMK